MALQESWSDDSSSGSDRDELTSSAPDSNSGDEDHKEVEQLIRKESKDVTVWREMVTGMLVITGALITISTFVLFSRLESHDFSEGFEDVASNIAEGSQFRMQIMEESLLGLGDVLTSYSLTSESEWPFVNMPDFDVHADHVRKNTGLYSVWTAPLVNQSTRDDWVNFTVESTEEPIYEDIFVIRNGTVVPVTGPDPSAAIFQMSPFPSEQIPLVNSPINLDFLASFNLKQEDLDSVDSVFVSDVLPLSLFHFAYGTNASSTGPGSIFVDPVFESHQNGTIVGYLLSLFYWQSLFEDIISGNHDGIVCVLENSCSGPRTWEVYKDGAVFVGEGDLHDRAFEKFGVSVNLTSYGNGTIGRPGVCSFDLSVYPSAQYRSSYDSNQRAIYTAVIGVVFFGLAITFFLYDQFVQRRNDKIVATAARSNKIVSSLFPAAVRDQLFADGDGDDAGQTTRNRWLSPKSGISDFLQEDENCDDDFMFDSKPIADLFPECTIMFADLVGFTAWSSVREPSQVFTLLETVYRAFDQIAKKRKIFKVETVGDCYVAVSGLPDPRKDHAVAMSKFASDCLRKVHEVTKKLEVALGPDTADLTCRIGLNSGPVTAGVLRGEKSRFQLFGDTMNTAARMESTGQRDRIQISQETADLLVSAGKTHWVVPREDKVVAKGKGEMQTFWLRLHTGGSNQSSGSGPGTLHDTDLDDNFEQSTELMQNVQEDTKVQRLMGDKTSRLIDWNVDILLSLLKQIVARRRSISGTSLAQMHDLEPLESRKGNTVIDEVTEIITLPEFDPSAAQHVADAEGITIDENVVSQLLDYVTNVAIMYNENPFHCFDHASHVCMSVTKLMSRIVAPSDLLGGISADIGGHGRNKLAMNLHDHTYGITSDPLTQFACVFSALIHDVDHSGVPNSTLIKENSSIAKLYKNKSVAEQNSVDLAWELLSDDSYADLRHAIYATAEEQRRFRQLVVNSVMATDIMDKDLKSLRNARWEKAFDPDFNDDSMQDSVNRKATIVIEHLIQASDVAHTMQHWHIYRKWNERLFKENYIAYKTGRIEADPSVNWYKGEIGFFDFYIIPLAKKLKDCGVFGVSSAEYLNYATVNRHEWEMRGQQIVSEMLENANKELTTHSQPKASLSEYRRSRDVEMPKDAQNSTASNHESENTLESRELHATGNSFHTSQNRLLDSVSSSPERFL